MVFIINYKCNCIHRGIPVCSDHIFKQRCVSSHHRSHGIVCNDICGSMESSEKPYTGTSGTWLWRGASSDRRTGLLFTADADSGIGNPFGGTWKDEWGGYGR